MRERYKRLIRVKNRPWMNGMIGLVISESYHYTEIWFFVGDFTTCLESSQFSVLKGIALLDEEPL